MRRPSVRRHGIVGGLVPPATSTLRLLGGIPAGSVAGAEPGFPLPRSGQAPLASGVLREANGPLLHATGPFPGGVIGSHETHSHAQDGGRSLNDGRIRPRYGGSR